MRLKPQILKELRPQYTTCLEELFICIRVTTADLVEPAPNGMTLGTWSISLQLLPVTGKT